MQTSFPCFISPTQGNFKRCIIIVEGEDRMRLRSGCIEWRKLHTHTWHWHWHRNWHLGTDTKKKERLTICLTIGLALESPLMYITQKIDKDLKIEQSWTGDIMTFFSLLFLFFFFLFFYLFFWLFSLYDSLPSHISYICSSCRGYLLLQSRQDLSFSFSLVVINQVEENDVQGRSKS